MVGGKLRSDNRRVNLAQQIPREDIEGLYASSLSGTGQGAPARSVRIAPGALIIKERLRMSDEEIDRIAIEGKFGQGKRRYSLGRIMTKLDHIRKTAIVMSFLVDESGKRAKGRLFVFFTPASRSLWPLFSGLYLRAYKKNCDNLDVCPCSVWAFLPMQAFSGNPIYLLFATEN
jgi:hypothetical protein